MAHHGPVPVTAGPDVRDLAVALGHTPESWQAAGHTFEPYSGVFRANPYVVILPPPPRVVAASAPPAPKETVSVGTDGCLILGTRADALLRSWSAPIDTGRGAAATPLLVVGQTLWPVVTKRLRQLAAYPINYDRISLSELPCDATLMAFRTNTCRSRVIMVSMPSVATAAKYAHEVSRLQATMPQHSFAFFTVAPGADLDSPPAPVRERYTVLTWRDTHAPAVQPAAPSMPHPDQRLTTVEASHLAKGGTVGLGITPGQRLGLEPLPFRDAARAAWLQQTEQVARNYNKMEGNVHDAKRVKVSHFNRGAGVVMHNTAHVTARLDQ